jgi:hypothetical protein
MKRGSPSGTSPPNTARHRIAARLRFLLNVKSHGWAARGARER